MRRRSWKRTFWALGALLGLEAIGALAWAATSQASWSIYMIAVMAPFVYFFPTLWAWLETMPNLGGIFAINLVVGWTLVGWLVLMIYLSMQPSASRHYQSPQVFQANARILSPDGYYFWDGMAWRPVSK
jgi:hypothetical protein